MKKLITSYIASVLSDLKCYRKRKGGKWYKIREYDVSGFAAPGESWVQSLPDDDQYHLLAEEEY